MPLRRILSQPLKSKCPFLRLAVGERRSLFRRRDEPASWSGRDLASLDRATIRAFWRTGHSPAIACMWELSIDCHDQLAAKAGDATKLMGWGIVGGGAQTPSSM
jgi:hypothetical protein